MLATPAKNAQTDWTSRLDISVTVCGTFRVPVRGAGKLEAAEADNAGDAFSKTYKNTEHKAPFIPFSFPPALTHIDR